MCRHSPHLSVSVLASELLQLVLLCILLDLRLGSLLSALNAQNSTGSAID